MDDRAEQDDDEVAQPVQDLQVLAEEDGQPPPTPVGDLRRVLRVTAELALLAVVLGVAVGLLWSALAPEVRLQVSDGTAYLDEVEGARVIGRDGWFAALAAAGGILLGVAGWLRHRSDAVPLVIGTALAGALGTFVAWRIGTWTGPAALPDQLSAVASGGTLVDPLRIEAKGVLLVWSILALGVVFLFALVQPTQRHVPTHGRRRPDG